MRRCSRIILRITAVACVCTGLQCGVLAKRNRVLTGLLDEHLAPKTTVAQVALSPVAMPVGLATLTVDAVLINPVLHVPDAIEIANWVFTEVPFTGFGEIIVFPMRIISYPVMFVGAMIFYITIPIPID